MTKKETLGRVLRIFTSSEVSRTEIDEIEVDENGILKDKYYEKNPNRAILISSKKSYDLVKEDSINIKYGDLKENIIFDFDIHQLKVGNRIQIGESILEISENCTICSQLKKIGNKVPELLKNDRGIFVKAIQSGHIKIDDLVHKA